MTDVRMRGFVRRHSVDAALALLDALLQPLDSQLVPVPGGHGRVVAEAIVSAVDVPGFDRAMMDGYAVVSGSTHGASADNPRALLVIGEAFPGRPFAGPVIDGHAVRIMTGAPLPPGCDAVVPAEFIDTADTPRVGVRAAVRAGQHVGRRGEDIERGTTVVERGRMLRPQDLGVLSSIGVSGVPVIRRPRVRVAVTGNELLPAGSMPEGYSIADANGPMLAALASRDGAVVELPGIVPDEYDAILEALSADVDVILVSGGSSVGIEDLAPAVLARHGELIVHGIAIRPGAPTGFGRIGHRLVFLLPGNPVSCLCGYDFFAGRAVRALGGRPKQWPYRSVLAPLAHDIRSRPDRLSYVRIRLAAGQVEQVAGLGAAVLSSTTRGDGFIVVPDGAGTVPAGTSVQAWLYD